MNMFRNRPGPVAPFLFAGLAALSYAAFRGSGAVDGPAWLGLFGLPAVLGAAVARIWKAASPFSATMRGAVLVLLGAGTLGSAAVMAFLSFLVLPVALGIGGIAQLVTRSDRDEPLWAGRLRRARERAAGRGS
jgi:hypothetical protein